MKKLLVALLLLAGCSQPSAPRTTGPARIEARIVNLAWNPNSPAEMITRYGVYERHWDGRVISPWVKVKEVPGPSTSVVASYGITLYTVTAISLLGESPKSNQVRVAAQ